VRFWNTCFEVGNFEKCNSMQHHHCEDNCIALLVSCLARLHNFCIEHLTNGPEGYVPLVNNNSHAVPTPKDILDGGNHFDDCPWTARQSRRVTNNELPQTVLFNLVIDSHKTRPLANMRSRNNKK
jgi:hypothetical protein